MCIYLGEDKELTYDSQEHIFSAAIGGTKKLPHTYVSNQANNNLSRLEDQVYKYSYLAFIRGHYGPGSRNYRGYNNPNRLPRTAISLSVDEFGEWALCYSSYGIPRPILQIHRINCEEYKLLGDAEFDVEIFQSGAESFINKLRNFNLESRFVTIYANDFPDDGFIFGCNDGKFFVGVKAGITITSEEIISELDKFLQAYDKTELENHAIGRRLSHSKIHARCTITSAMERVFAKTALNVLAELKGYEYVMHNRFDEIKHYILDDDNKELMSLPKINTEKNLLPEKCHWCYFTQENGQLYAIVCLYNLISFAIDLGSAIDEFGLPNRLDGMICDWQNRREITFKEWIIEMC